ncbi:MAG: CARDB domain-containing protein, partial [Phycisphaeraceae bacterium]|nr:CARDB domain-containing protein [Phycisphaeraceae bacterium]
DWDQPSAPFQQALQELSREASVFLVPVGGSDANLAVTGLDLVSGTLRKGTVARYRATVHNYGPSPAANVDVRCRVEGVQIDNKQIPQIAPGTSETVSLFVPFYNAGATRITAEVADETLATDNVRRAVAVVRDRVSVLCIDGSSGGAGRLIEAALLARAAGSEDEDYRVQSITWPGLPAGPLDAFDVVVLANVPEITPGQAEQLEQFVRRGNGLIWLGGENVKPDKWQQLAGHGLLPASPGLPVDTRDSLGVGRPLDPTMPDHMVGRPLQSLPEDLLNETRFLKQHEVEPDETSFTVLSLAGSRSPLLLEHSLGRGHVFMFTTSADTAWNNMAQTPVFPMLMQQIVTYLVGREFEPSRVVGDALTLSYVDQPDASDAVFTTPSDQTIEVPVRESRGDYVALLEQSTEAGFYVARVSVQSSGTPIAVNVDTRESDVATVGAAQLREQLADTGVTVSDSEASLSADIVTARTGRSSWRYFLMAALAFFVIEALLADYLTGRKQTPAAPATEAS